MTTIAHVGHTKTSADCMRIAIVMDWCRERNIPYAEKPVFLDLRWGKDFLAETRTYDMVLLHMPFNGETHDMERMQQFCREHTPEWRKQVKQFLVSPHASWSGWCRRLKQTGAKYIFAFGSQGTVGGPYIAHLDGYDTCTWATTKDEFTVFIKRQPQ